MDEEPNNRSDECHNADHGEELLLLPSPAYLTMWQ
jgi:hypothetical protein